MSTSKTAAPPNMLVGMFSTLKQAEKAIEGLKHIGLASKDITVISSSDVVKNHFQQYRPDVDVEDWKKAAVLGGTTGAVLAGLSSVVALATGAGIPILLAGGLASFITGGVVGSLAGAMTERGFETEAADYFELAVADGKTLVAVDLTGRSDEAQQRPAVQSIFQDAGSEPVALTKNPDFSSK